MPNGKSLGARDAYFSGITSMYVLGEYSLRNGLLIITKTIKSRAALVTDGTKAARMAGSEAEPSLVY